ncbi:MAG: prepilin-type N-terminal cleavage/methylation domain-containing protein [Opitutaceae bacterium]|jgi:general secretion pathway protein G|nr:prepilin-type N-terminal cleavage/methylation domain-containing protein [Opitutaceae bacterium]
MIRDRQCNDSTFNIQKTDTMSDTGQKPAVTGCGAASAAASAFTLIELLTVIAIIGILAALSFVGISKSRTLANRAVCASNLRQIHLALQLFAQDYKCYPNYNASDAQPTGAWAKRLDDYIPSDKTLPGAGSYSGKSVFTCPERMRQFPNAGEAKKACTYGLSNWFAGVAPWTQIKPVRADSLTLPSRTILVGDCAWSESGKYPFQNIQNDMPPGSVRDRVSGGAPSPGTHGDGAANLLYADGHVAWFANTELLKEEKYRNKSADDLWSPVK